MRKDTLTGIKVKHAMRKQIIMLDPDDSINCCIQYLIKWKVNAILICENEKTPLGVISKTDIMSAWYAGLPLSTPVEMIMNSPPIFCTPEDTLDSALNQMMENQIYRLFVMTSDSNKIAGALAYPDIVGLLYYYCSQCAQSLFNRKSDRLNDQVKRYKVLDIMTKQVETCKENSPLESVVEILASSRFGAILVADDNHMPKGVISRTDIILCYRHGDQLSVPAGTIMSTPILCQEEELVESAIKVMILEDLHRLFVVKGENQAVSGVISLTDAARMRSGSCHACIVSRLQVDKMK